MKKIVSLLYFLVFIMKVHAQETKQRKWEAGIDFGNDSYVLNDKLLNYYTYKGSEFSPYNIHFYHVGKYNLYLLSASYGVKKMSTSQASELYKFNTIKLYNFELKAEYYRKLRTIDHFSCYLGASYNFYATDLFESYLSQLWAYTTDQYSYDYSDVLSINALLNYQYRKSTINIKAGYAFLNYGNRPSDFYVKYGQDPNSKIKFYSINDYQNIQFSLGYRYDISSRFSLRLQYLNEYRAYLSVNGFKFLKQSWLAGVSYKF